MKEFRSSNSLGFRATAMIATAIGALAIGRLAIRRVLVESLTIQDLTVTRLRAAEVVISDSLELSPSATCVREV